MSEPALVLERVERTFQQADRPLHVLRGVDLRLQPGEIVAMVGPSGCGKSTLLHVAGLLEAPDAGEVVIEGKPCARMADADRTATRRRVIGFVYQYHHLLPEFSALENVMMPQLIAGTGKSDAKVRARELLSRLGLAERLTHRPARLSGGEQQRVAIARAVANRPKVLLADEPTGNLDENTAAQVFDELLHLVRDAGVAALIATHNRDLAQSMDRVLELHDGVLVQA